jgi:small subunit ribosomal protein S9
MANATNFTWGTGRRKKAVARVRLATGEGRMTVNRRDWEEYFPTPDTRVAVRQPLKVTESEKRYDVFISVAGGGPQGQAEAVRHGLARALASANPSLEAALRDAGFLTRDARMKERKKYGQRGARARFQFSKR